MYKAEFRHHHYKRRLRPRSAYTMGLIYWWSRLASRTPALTNFMLRQEPLATALKRIAQVTPHRQMPAYARETFKRWFFGRHESRMGGEPVVLWPDTFNNYFEPGVLRAAVEVLESAGCAVRVPWRSLCCCRPLFYEGMLDLARAKLAEILDVLAPEIAAERPVVGLEPACVSTFRDELTHLFPNDPRAEKLARNTFSLAEFLQRRDYRPPEATGRALVHVHCNEHAVLDPAAGVSLLQRAGLEAERLRSGCCGMAGSFGYEADKYDISVRIGEQMLLPTVRDAPRDALIVADGFSCREQIRHGTSREPVHLAQVLAARLGRLGV
jgi:Fe-S oxidoreductase